MSRLRDDLPPIYPDGHITGERKLRRGRLAGITRHGRAHPADLVVQPQMNGPPGTQPTPARGCARAGDITSIVERLRRPRQLVRLEISDQISLHHGVGIGHAGRAARDVVHLGEGLVLDPSGKVRPKRFYGVVILLLRSQAVIPGGDSLQRGAVVVDVELRNVGTFGFRGRGVLGGSEISGRDALRIAIGARPRTCHLDGILAQQTLEV
jgi:hypothetical protein